MDMKGYVKFLVVMGMVVSGCRGDVNSFRDCYAKCFIFCMIEPNKSLCTCTTQCLKECIFPSITSTKAAIDPHTQNLGYCKLGCATSLCSQISKVHNPGIYTFKTTYIHTYIHRTFMRFCVFV